MFYFRICINKGDDCKLMIQWKQLQISERSEKWWLLIILEMNV